jgi:hypothetical protein
LNGNCQTRATRKVKANSGVTGLDLRKIIGASMLFDDKRISPSVKSAARDPEMNGSRDKNRQTPRVDQSRLEKPYHECLRHLRTDLKVCLRYWQAKGASRLLPLVLFEIAKRPALKIGNDNGRRNHL